MGPTSANSSPARFVFVRTPEGKEKLKPALSEGQPRQDHGRAGDGDRRLRPEVLRALPKLFPHADARSWFAGNEALAEATAFRNGTLQGAYLIMAARAVGLDAGADVRLRQCQGG